MSLEQLQKKTLQLIKRVYKHLNTPTHVSGVTDGEFLERCCYPLETRISEDRMILADLERDYLEQEPSLESRPAWIDSAANECAKQVLIGHGAEYFAKVIERAFSTAIAEDRLRHSDNAEKKRGPSDDEVNRALDALKRTLESQAFVDAVHGAGVQSAGETE